MLRPSFPERSVIALAAAAFLAAPLLVSSCGRPAEKRPEAQCTVEGKQVECWWVLYGCMPKLAPRDACLSLCREQEQGQLKVCEGNLPQQPGKPLMMSVRHLGCDQCIRMSDRPLIK